MFQFTGFPPPSYGFRCRYMVFPCGFPHSDICGSLCMCHSPQLFAAYHVFLRLLVPRHPPCALIALPCNIVLVLLLCSRVSRLKLNFLCVDLFFRSCALVRTSVRADPVLYRIISFSSTFVNSRLRLDVLIFQYSVFKVHVDGSCMIHATQSASHFFVTGFALSNDQSRYAYVQARRLPSLLVWHGSLPTWRW